MKMISSLLMGTSLLMGVRLSLYPRDYLDSFVSRIGQQSYHYKSQINYKKI